MYHSDREKKTCKPDIIDYPDVVKPFNICVILSGAEGDNHEAVILTVVPLFGSAQSYTSG